MIDTLMALWNRGYGGRSIGVFFAFILICISISLLLITSGVSLLFDLAHGGPPQNRRTFVNSASLTASARPPATGPTVAPAATTTPCLLTPLPDKTATAGARNKGGNTFPRRSTGTPGQGGPRVTPTVKATSTPRPQPRPTPTLAPTVMPTTIPTATPTPIPTTTPSPTPTVTVTPTSTTTPVENPTPVDTPTPTLTPTGTTGVPVATDTPVSAPTLMPIVTPGDGSSQARIGTSGHGVHQLLPGSTNAGSWGKAARGSPDCLSDSVAFMGTGPVLRALEQGIWLILLGSCLSTLLFCGALALLRRKR